MTSQTANDGSLRSPTTMRARELAMREQRPIPKPAADPNQPLTGKQEHCENDFVFLKNSPNKMKISKESF